MNYFKTLLLSTGLLLATASFSNVRTLCRGFLPENDMKIPIRVMQAGGITQDDFNDVLDHLEKYYVPIVKTKGGDYKIKRLWTDDTVNASAERQGNTWVLNMYGGLARHPLTNKDTFYLVACHETGHHLGGAPQVSSFFGGSQWASNEGQADYYASLDCMRFMFNEKDNEDFVNKNTIDPTLLVKCGSTYTTQAEKNLCVRMGAAGLNAALMFQSFKKNSKTSDPSFTTPDKNVVSRTDDNHPEPQCRLDTYFAGALCFHDLTVEPGQTDTSVGTCSEAKGATVGVRPHCWFSTSTTTNDPNPFPFPFPFPD